METKDKPQPSTPKPAVGRIVHYRLSEADAEQIEAARDHSLTHGQAHQLVHLHDRGNTVEADQVYPAVVVRVWPAANGCVNLQVLLDGNDTYWAHSRNNGDEPGTWSWPPRD